jgi:hypothetical protein
MSSMTTPKNSSTKRKVHLTNTTPAPKRNGSLAMWGHPKNQLEGPSCMALESLMRVPWSRILSFGQGVEVHLLGMTEQADLTLIARFLRKKKQHPQDEIFQHLAAIFHLLCQPRFFTIPPLLYLLHRFHNLHMKCSLMIRVLRYVINLISV